MTINQLLSLPQCPNCRQKTKLKLKIKNRFNLYFCSQCQNGFTYPVPQDLKPYYIHQYWTSNSLTSQVKDLIFSICHRRRILWVTNKLKQGTILDVGAGQALFAQQMPSNYQVISQEPKFSRLKSSLIIKKNFLSWPSKPKFKAVCFWQSLEHTPEPLKYLNKAFQILKPKGYLFIEYPRYKSLESKIFKKNWYHLDMPRHLVHLTNKGLTCLLKKSGFKILKIKSISAPDYALWGFIASCLNLINFNLTDKLKQNKNPLLNLLVLIIIIPLIPLSLIFHLISIITRQSPIGLIIAQKS